MYIIRFSKQADKDKKSLKEAGLDSKAKNLLNVIAENPFQNPPPYEKLQGNLRAYYSRRINRQHRLIYMIDEPKKTVKIVSMWTHYE